VSLLFCCSLALAKKTEPPLTPPQRPEVSNADVVTTTEPGSLWNEVQARRVVGLDAGARQVGDLVTVLILEQTTTAIDASTDTARDSTVAAGIDALLGAEKGILDAHPDMGGKIALGAGATSAYSGTGGTSRGSAIETMLTCEVIEVMPNGNLHIWGYKQVRVNRETQYVVLDGVVRPRDIRMDNTVVSDRLAQAKFEVTGSGVVADKQGPGILTRALDHLWPF
jgi:flagellar L-ring protein precursor FlgH